MTRNEIKDLVKKHLKNEMANDKQIAAALGMTKGNFSKYTDPLNVGQVKTIKSWCFDNYDDVSHLIPSYWSDGSVDAA